MSQDSSQDSNTPVNGTIIPPNRSRRTAWIVAGVLAAGLTAAATTAFSQGPGFGPLSPVHWHGRFMGAMGWPLDPAQIEDRADRMVRHVAIEIDATSEQQEKLRTVVRSAVRDILPMREKARSARATARDLLTQQTVDRAAIERFRTEQLALADAFSKRVAQAIGDMGEILTPEQRRKLADRLPPPPEGGPRWNR
jgi:Spy/CpxP family protein refolding chaperone